MRRRLVTSDQAVPAKGQHSKPCSDCPWARTALCGWLGSNTIDEWIAMAHGETRIDCHTRTGAQCAGAAIYRANVAKSPRDQTLLRLPRDAEHVFATANEFFEHHSSAPRGEGRPRPRRRIDSLKGQLAEIEDLINEVEGDKTHVDREQYREFLEELRGVIETRLLALDEDG